MKSIKLKIKSRLENVSLVGLTVNKICSTVPFSEDDVYQTELCVVEACNNVIKHAYSNRPDQDIEINIDLDLDKITFNILDIGRPMESDILPSLDFDPNDSDQLPEGGMGLFLVNQIMNKVEYKNHNGQNNLTLTKFYISH